VRQHRVYYEELVRFPEREIKDVCAFLGVEFESSMLDPYGSEPDRMIDGIHTESKMIGDIKFHQYRQIDQEPANQSPWEVSKIAREVARHMGLDAL
jgi:hypothetical protein